MYKEIKVGETLQLPIRVWDSDEEEYVDITDYKLFFTVKNEITDEDDDALIATDATGIGEVATIEYDTSDLIDGFEDDEIEKTAIADFKLIDTDNKKFLTDAFEIVIKRAVTVRES
jgi:hypothetical protein